MPRSEGRFHHRILGRMLLVVVLPTALILALVVFLAAWRGFVTRLEDSKASLQAQSDLIAWEIEAVNRDAVISAERMADAQMAGMFGDRDASLEYARLVLDDAEDFTAAYFCYEPNADGQDEEGPRDALPAEAMDVDGRFVPYWFVDPSKRTRSIVLEPSVDMETSAYYAGVRRAFEESGETEAMVTEPYVYQGKMIVEQTYPIVIKGKFAGVAGVDRALGDVEQYLRQLAEDLEVDAFLISSRDHFIAATTDSTGQSGDTSELDLNSKATTDTPYRDLFDRVIAEARNGHPLVERDPTDGRKYYFAAAHVPTGDWTVVLRQPVSEILAPAFAQIKYGVAVVVLGSAFIFLLMITNIVRVSRRINVAVAAADGVSRGDLTQEIDPGDCLDETGTLLHSLRTMNDSLNSLVGGVKSASIQINSTATELAATSRQQESVANTFGSSATQIAAAVKEISATGTQLVQTMGEVSEIAADTSELAMSGRAGLAGMEETMIGLDEATGSIADKLAVINDKATNITGVVTTITKVAEQTNLLSVNAAIEAEKAGEYGVGFLVVAREIRRLADQSASATLDIEQMVEQMQSAVSAGVMEMDRFADQVRRSVKDVDKVGQLLAQIIEQVAANTASFASVNEGMQSQSQGADQISEAMAQLTEGATQTSESIREYAGAADDLQNAIGSLKSSIATFHIRS